MILECSGERVIDEHTYEWCGRRVDCACYMNPTARSFCAQMDMPAEKPCPHFVEWRKE